MASALRNSEGIADADRPITELTRQGEALLQRVEEAKKI